MPVRVANTHHKCVTDLIAESAAYGCDGNNWKPSLCVGNGVFETFSVSLRVDSASLFFHASGTLLGVPCVLLFVRTASLRVIQRNVRSIGRGESEQEGVNTMMTLGCLDDVSGDVTKWLKNHGMMSETSTHHGWRKVKQRWRSAADAARITDINAGSKVCKHTSGGVLVTIDNALGAVVAVKSIPSNEGRIAQAWVNV